MVIGIDEVGRGCWAGPLCVAAVRLLKPIEGLNDSKLLRPRQRERLAQQIRQHAEVSIAWMASSEIDKWGLTAALTKAVTIAAGQHQDYDEVIIDGSYNFLAGHNKPVQVIVGGDKLIPEVSAASIIAKVARDNFMKKVDKAWPEYGFAVHVGYGTARHREALKTYGVTPLHRRSYKPIQAMEFYHAAHSRPASRDRSRRISDSSRSSDHQP